MSMRVAVTGLGMFLPGYPNATAWAERNELPEDEPRKPGGLAFDRVNRRRASQMGRAIGDAVAEAMAAAEVDGVTTPVIVGSSILIGGSGCGFSGSEIVSPMLIDSRPVIATKSPGPA